MKHNSCRYFQILRESELHSACSDEEFKTFTDASPYNAETYKIILFPRPKYTQYYCKVLFLVITPQKLYIKNPSCSDLLKTAVTTQYWSFVRLNDCQDPESVKTFHSLAFFQLCRIHCRCHFLGIKQKNNKFLWSYN